MTSYKMTLIFEDTLSTMTYLGKPGEYTTQCHFTNKYKAVDKTFVVGDWYGMKAHEIHSIKFSKEAIVLFIEGENKTDSSVYLEPCVGGPRFPL